MPNACKKFRRAGKPGLSEGWKQVFVLLLLSSPFLMQPAAASDAHTPRGYPDFQTALKSQMHVAGAQSQGPAPAGDSIGKRLVVPAVLLFAGVVAARKLGPRVVAVVYSRVGAGVAADTGTREKVLLQSRPAPREALPEPQPPVPIPDSANESQDPLERFFEVAPRRLQDIRKIFSRISRVTNTAGRRKILDDLSLEFRSFKELCDAPGLAGVGQLAAALEALLRQVMERPSNLSPSTLPTAAAAILLLEKISAAGVQTELPSAARILAVDDDAISRRAISMALKKSFNEPEASENGEAALLSVTKRAYDVIFLDAEIPGMDGFELCTKIHETELNRHTPVVFVTSHNDFDARANASSAGGQQLIGKPFLAGEIIVKALTLMLQKDLEQKTAGATEPASDSDAGEIASDHKEELSVAGNEVSPDAAALLKKPAAGRSSALSASETEKTSSAEASDSRSHEFADAFFAQAPEHLAVLREQLQVAVHSAEGADRQEALTEFHFVVHALTADALRAEWHSIFRVASALEKLVLKLLENPQAASVSALGTAAASLELLEDLCFSGEEPGLAGGSFEILIVDDDPVACRALAGALQLTFGRPETVASGEAALARTAEKEFDVIFLDILMPGMDGFATCAKIRNGERNQNTSVVFITGQNDLKARTQSRNSGGNAFIPKPVLPVEISLAALVFSLAGRLRKRSAQPLMPGKLTAVSA